MESQNLLEMVKTRAAVSKNLNNNLFKGQVFIENSIIKNDVKKFSKKCQLDNKPSSSFDIKSARNDVLKLSLSGLPTANKVEAQKNHALKLGAKEPKKPYKNYKELLNEKQILQKTIKDKNDFLQLGKTAGGKALHKYKKGKHKKSHNFGEISKNYGIITKEHLKEK